MTNETLNEPLLEHTDPSLARPLPLALAGARADLIEVAHDLLAIPEAALTLPWTWIGGSEQEVRYGAYRAAEALEQAEIEARAAAAVADPGERRGALIVGPSTAARWDLHGLLLPLDEHLLDADPREGGWSLRLVVGHIIASQRGYGWGTAWWQAQGYDLKDPGLPTGAPDSLWAAMPDEVTAEAAGGIDDLRTRLDAIVDLSAERLAGLPDDRLALGSRWSGFPVTVGFRLGRWASHIREHAIQVEKTLAMLGHEPNEPARLVRHVLAAYGRAEAVVFGHQGVDDAVDRVVQGVAEARRAVRAAREAAG
ncbi:MAG: DinB family protein [Candidatus Limnocylindrales bacterium]|nr:DinB family protein [Candidatus Limnocylindrales bacterium]